MDALIMRYVHVFTDHQTFSVADNKAISWNDYNCGDIVLNEARLSLLLLLGLVMNNSQFISAVPLIVLSDSVVSWLEIQRMGRPRECVKLLT